MPWRASDEPGRGCTTPSDESLQPNVQGIQGMFGYFAKRADLSEVGIGPTI